MPEGKRDPQRQPGKTAKAQMNNTASSYEGKLQTAGSGENL